MPLISLQHLAQLSRDKSFLIRTSLSIVAMSVTLSFVISTFTGDSAPAPATIVEETGASEAINALPSTNWKPSSLAQWIYSIRTGLPATGEPSDYDLRTLTNEPLGYLEKYRQEFESDFPMLKLLYEGLPLEANTESIEALLKYSEEERYRNEFIGDLYAHSSNFEKATEFYQAELSHYPNSTYSARSAIIAALWSGNRTVARELITRPGAKQLFRFYDLMSFQADARAWGPLFFSSVKHDYRQIISVFCLPALFTGLVWFLILTNFWQFNRTRLAMSLAAVGLGMISTTLTLYAVMIQERSFGFTENPNDTELYQLIFWVSGVGLREETLKLICFLPLAFWCARRKNDLEAFILAALVGLGFAIQENIGYFSDSLYEHAALTRLLTANPLHFSLTGLVGFYAYRMIVRKFYGWEEFLAVYILAVVLHGIYDAVLSIPGWEDYSILTIVFIAILIYRFFDPLKKMMDLQSQRRRLSPLGIFVLGATTITCIVMIFSATFFDFRPALASFAAAVGSMIPQAFAYISRFRDL